MGLTREIGEFVAGMRFERVPPAAIDTVGRGFTDCVGVMLAGLTQPVAAIVAKAVGLAVPVSRLAEFGEAGISAPDLALIYGTAAHALDYDDTGLNGHPSAVLVPAILAEAQEVNADGKAMIAAYVTGYEIWAELVDREPELAAPKGVASVCHVRNASRGGRVGGAAQARRRARDPRGRDRGVTRRRRGGELWLDDETVPPRPHRAVRPDCDAARTSRPDRFD